MTVALVWFRNDLRVRDHEPLTDALRQHKRVEAIYVMDERADRTAHHSLRTGIHRRRFLYESIVELSKSLADLGVRLTVTNGSVANEVIQYANDNAIDAIYAYHDPAVEEQRDMEKVQSKVQTLHLFHGKTLVHPDDLPFSIDDLPNMFTSFRKQVEKESEIRRALPVPDGHGAGESTNVSKSVFGLGDDVDQGRYAGGESEGIARVHHYFSGSKSVSTYKETRNGMLEEDDSTKFSPYLAAGCLSPRMIYDELLKYERENGANDSTYWVFFELLWRDYFSFLQEQHGKKLYRAGGIKGLDIPWLTDEERLEAWKKGETGNPLVDASMRELNATGYTSNRARQNVAAFFVQVLRLDWRLGAAYYEQMLVDYDAASNYGNWNYVASIGNDPRGFRIFNVEKQRQQYDPDGRYVTHWNPDYADRSLIVNVQQELDLQREAYHRAEKKRKGKKPSRK